MYHQRRTDLWVVCMGHHVGIPILGGLDSRAHLLERVLHRVERVVHGRNATADSQLDLQRGGGKGEMGPKRVSDSERVLWPLAVS